jgi:hypothetical protein
MTPYRRPPYSFVADSFICMGDAACLTKPSAGEGVTSSMVQVVIAAEAIAELLKSGKDLDKKSLWPINKRYVDKQGAEFAGMLAMLTGAVATSAKENDFFFEKDIVFSKKSFESMASGEALAFSTADMISMALTMLGGVIAGRLRISTISSLLKGMGNGGKITKLYNQYPETPEGFDEWVKQADELWAACGSMADMLDKA